MGASIAALARERSQRFSAPDVQAPVVELAMGVIGHPGDRSTSSVAGKRRHSLKRPLGRHDLAMVTASDRARPVAHRWAHLAFPGFPERESRDR
jgi:hypothetical protein